MCEIKTRMGISRLILCLVPCLLILSGCVQALDRAKDGLEAEEATLPGYGNVRMYLDARLDEMMPTSNDWATAPQGRNLETLMISGGGAGGAFSVGVLSAWTARKTRPQFDVVSGVSTGALIAPFAFLGSSYDETLRKVYTSGMAERLVGSKTLGGVLGASLLKVDPLRKMLEELVTPAILAKVAVEHQKGRRLFVLTTNLDSQRAVVWNLGAIANSGRPDALKLFQDVMIASASIPGVYPAVMIKAQANGRLFNEMHSDGGSASQILMLPQVFLTSDKPLIPRNHGAVNLYVIVNNALMPEFSQTPEKTFSAIGKAFSIFVKSQTQSSLIALYNYAKRTGARFHLASIDVQLTYSMLDPFNTNYMRAVYNLGYAELSANTLWKDEPVFR